MPTTNETEDSEKNIRVVNSSFISARWGSQVYPGGLIRLKRWDTRRSVFVHQKAQPNVQREYLREGLLKVRPSLPN